CKFEVDTKIIPMAITAKRSEYPGFRLRSSSGRRLANRKGNPPRGRCAARQTVPWARNRARTRSAGAGQTRLRARERLRRPICGQGADTSGDAARSSQNRNEWQCNDLILLILVAATGLEPALRFPRSRF